MTNEMLTLHVDNNSSSVIPREKAEKLVALIYINIS